MRKEMLLPKDRPTTMVSIKMPLDVTRDLEAVAEAQNVSSIEALIQMYIGQGLRKDIKELRRKNSAEQAKQILGKYNVDPKIIEEVVTVMS